MRIPHLCMTAVLAGALGCALDMDESNSDEAGTSTGENELAARPEEADPRESISIAEDVSSELSAVCGSTTCGGGGRGDLGSTWTCYRTAYGCGRVLRGGWFEPCGSCPTCSPRLCP